MADRYRLPEALGGAEFEASAITGPGGQQVGHMVGKYVVWLPVALLTKVEPPLPPEPRAGTVVLDASGVSWQRDNEDRPHHWLTALAGDEDWEGLQAYGPLTRLVPDPAAGVELPARISDTVNDRVAVIRANPDRDFPSVLLLVESEPTIGRSISFRPDAARQAAAALWAAADASEAGAR